jgi:hypothetical protein
MAKFLPGPLAGMISGSIGAVTFTRGRYGPFMRTRVHPTKVVNSYTDEARQYFTQVSQAWQSETASAQLAWKTWAQTAPIVNALGQKQTLSGHAAYLSVNARYLRINGTILSGPPTSQAPAPLTTCTITYDIGAGTTEIAFTPSPLGANLRLWVMASLTPSPGSQYLLNQMKLIHVSAANLASPYDWAGAINTRFGAFTAGWRAAFMVSVFNDTTGLLSAPHYDSAVITTT